MNPFLGDISMKSTVALLMICMALLYSLTADGARDEDIKYLERMLIAPCCFRQPVSDHESEAAYRVKEDIRARLERGESPDEILQAYSEEYGIRILAKPPASGFNTMAYLLPLILGALGLMLVLLMLLSWRKKPGQTVLQSTTAPSLSTGFRLEERIEEELRQLER